MKILLTGATGYIGKRLIPNLLKAGHDLVCCVRDTKRFAHHETFGQSLDIIEVDFLKEETLQNIPEDIDAAYYLIHSMSAASNYQEMELKSARLFREQMDRVNVKQVIYLSGIVNKDELSKHLSSRKAVETELKKGHFHLTTLRAGIIIGSGSASFEIIRDLVEKLPVMIAPKWLNTRCQPIGVRDVLYFLIKVLEDKRCFDQHFDIGGPEILTYKEMLLGFARVRKLKRYVFTVPVMTPRLSSYWLYFVTSTSYKLASALVSSMKIEVICQDQQLNEIFDYQPETYEKALERSFQRIVNHDVVSSWKDTWASGQLNYQIADYMDVPIYGCFKDCRVKEINDRERTLQKIWALGGDTGWYAFDGLWKLRGFMDKMFGGVGLRRGRTNPDSISAGDVIDFWRVLIADRDSGRLLLYAEMKLPGEAWLEFRIRNNQLYQTATFRPTGLLGRLYWYSVIPFHGLVFRGMINHICQ
ncbi:SDR family oxidoreductase [Reichenbachiella ulvae]|uniref:SDR family oxidoreductase n=1 Tax=Reichenbachiella ulvae TaxID=2980104 RepID=A0ABT3CW01_9BACT|nr:SDR family oxidoreductase [Reichenbachiella ulvae]MCV9387779.1 SDR family oxidoreductase [Reichenbachiella ulvae]